MKKLLLISSLLSLALGSSAYAANSVSANANVKIVSAIAVVKASGGDMEFGSVAAPTTGSGTVVMDPSTGTATAGGTNVPTLITAGTATRGPATFNVTGENNATYTIVLGSLPSNLTSGANNIPIGTFHYKATSGTLDGTGTLGAGGTDTVKVGATITVASTAVAGAYTGTFNITVNYN